MGFAGDVVSQVLDSKIRTYRLRDHNLSIGDEIIFENSSEKKVFGYGKITEIVNTTVGKIDLQDKKHWKTYANRQELVDAFKRHYPYKDITEETAVWIYTYNFDRKLEKEGCGAIVASEIEPQQCPSCGGKKLLQDPDTLDTWFSSGLWTFSTLGWPDETADCKNFHQTDVLETGYEILFFWVARMILMSEYALGQIPFRTVYLHGTVRDAKGRKMSKSLGNGIDPIDVAKKFGTDAGRMALVVGNTPGTDTNISEDKIRGYKNFANKLWNIARFIVENKTDLHSDFLKDEDVFTDDISNFDKDGIWKLAKEVTDDLENYRLYLAAEKLYHSVWHTFADDILEQGKKILKGNDEKAKNRARFYLRETFENFLRLLHPFIPFVTEEIWRTMPARQNGGGNKTLLMVEPWPTGNN